MAVQISNRPGPASSEYHHPGHGGRREGLPLHRAFPGQWAEPQFHGPRQEAPYIVRDDGELVWSGYTYFSIWAANFQKARWNGQDVLFGFEGDHNPAYGHGHGHATILNQRYETIRELRAGNHKLMDKHEFHVIDEKTALLQVYQPVPKDLSRWGASAEQQWIVDAIFQGMWVLEYIENLMLIRSRVGP